MCPDVQISVPNFSLMILANQSSGKKKMKFTHQFLIVLFLVAEQLYKHWRVCVQKDVQMSICPKFFYDAKDQSQLRKIK